MPVIDGVAIAVRVVAALVATGLGTSKPGDLPWPSAEPCTGSLAHLSPGTPAV